MPLIDDLLHIGFLKEILYIDFGLLLWLTLCANMIHEVWALVAQLVLLSSSLLFFTSLFLHERRFFVNTRRKIAVKVVWYQRIEAVVSRRVVIVEINPTTHYRVIPIIWEPLLLMSRDWKGNRVKLKLTETKWVPSTADKRVVSWASAMTVGIHKRLNIYHL